MGFCRPISRREALVDRCVTSPYNQSTAAKDAALRREYTRMQTNVALTLISNRVATVEGILELWERADARRAETIAEARGASNCRVVIRDEVSPHYGANIRAAAAEVVNELRRAAERGVGAHHEDAIAAWQLVGKLAKIGTLEEVSRSVEVAANRARALVSATRKANRQRSA